MADGLLLRTRGLTKVGGGSKAQFDVYCHHYGIDVKEGLSMASDRVILGMWQGKGLDWRD